MSIGIKIENEAGVVTATKRKGEVVHVVGVEAVGGNPRTGKY